MMMILEITRGYEFQQYPPKLRGLIAKRLQEHIRKLKIEWPEDKMLGTKAIRNKQLVLITTPICRGELEKQFSFPLLDKDDEPVLDDNNEPITIQLDWNILACQRHPVDQAPLLPYFEAVPVFNEEGEQVGEEPVTDLTGKLQHWFGNNWIY